MLQVIEVALVPAPCPLVQHAADGLVQPHHPVDVPHDRHGEVPLDPPLIVQPMDQRQPGLLAQGCPPLLHGEGLSAQGAGSLSFVLHPDACCRLAEAAPAGRAVVGARCARLLVPDGIMLGAGHPLPNPFNHVLPYVRDAGHQLGHPLDAPLLLPVPAVPGMLQLQGLYPLVYVAAWPADLQGIQHQPAPLRRYREPLLVKDGPEVAACESVLQVLLRPQPRHVAGGILPCLHVHGMPAYPCPAVP